MDTDLATTGGEATTEAATATSTEALDNTAAEAADSTSANLTEASTNTDTTTDTTTDADSTDEDSKTDVPKLMSQAQIDKIVAGRLKSLTDEKVEAKAKELSKDALTSSEAIKQENATLKQELEAIKMASAKGMPSSILIKSKFTGKDLEEFADEYVAERKSWGFKPESQEQTLADKLNKSVSATNADSFNEARLAAVKGVL
jgi:DNA-binding ferritin-like protein (Dps family)